MQIGGGVIINDATELEGIKDESYDLVMSSNVLEHIANPLKALLEWKRILVSDGVLIIVVPNHKYGFDHNRDVTKFEHLLEDYNNNLDERDLSHLKEILEKHDLSMDKPAGTFEQFRERSMKNYENRCLHHHVFDLEILTLLAQYLEMEIVGIPFEGSNHIICLRK